MISDFIYRKPIDKAIIKKEDYICETVSGNIALMCPKCFHMIESKISYSKAINIGNADINCFYTSNEWYGICPACNESTKFEDIDINMAKTINILNNKGYYTAFCCEGHIVLDGSDGKESLLNPYIYFYFWDDIEILNTCPLPDTWYISDDCAECKIFSISDIILKGSPAVFKNDKEYSEYVNHVKKNWNQEKSLRDIYDWAVSLPIKSLTKSTAKRKIIEKYGKEILNINAEKLVACKFEGGVQ